MGANKSTKIGKIYGEIKVIEFLGHGRYKCQCLRCGRFQDIDTKYLSEREDKGTKVCTLCKKKEIGENRIKNKVGKKIGKLLVLEYLGNKKFRCLCECGKECEKTNKALNNNPNISCGHDIIHYNKNEEFFNEIDTEKKAYILGLIVSDGHINYSNNTLSIVLQGGDKELLEKVKKAIEYDGEIKIKYQKNSKDGTFSERAELFIHSKKIALSLKQLGISQRKSFEIETNFNLSCIPENLMSHFLRGLFDGDGSFNIRRCSRGDPCYSIAIMNSTPVIKQLKNYIESHFNNIKTDVKVQKNKYSSLLRMNNKRAYIEFLDYLYKDSTIFLERKYTLYLINKIILKEMDKIKNKAQGKSYNYKSIDINNKEYYLQFI